MLGTIQPPEIVKKQPVSFEQVVLLKINLLTWLQPGYEFRSDALNRVE